ncbi:hypothetical protein [Streptomyces sp. NBC_01304]|uniref:hypothetical protein n=1 Tax=Streptomyces sp. NBC_01304 TaxID=2903818 RepID=UPI002E15D332|nr:hypothetical protein OG430_30695 [Streptomyces sp. NBC_01304]
MGDVVGWAAFSCVLVPVVLVVYGTSFGGAAWAALGLAAVTGVCRVLLRQSERGAARQRLRDNGVPAQGGGVPAQGGDTHGPDDGIRRGRRGRTGSGAHRGGRHSA